MMKAQKTSKIISWLLCFVMVFTLLPMSAFAADGDTFDSGGMTYTVLSEEEATVSITGGSDESEVTIPSTVEYNGKTYTVTVIGADAFSSKNGLQKVTIPGTVTTIGMNAFSSCENLNQVIFDGNSALKAILSAAFAECRSLTTFTISEGVTSIEGNAFINTGLTSIHIPASVETIGGADPAFNTSSLTAYTVAEGNENYCAVDGVLFNKDKTTLVHYPMGKSGDTYTIPATVTFIGYDAFTGSKLTSISVPEGVTEIKTDAFNGCTNLTSISLPASLTNINGGSRFLWQCIALKEITVAQGNTAYSSIDGVLFRNGGKELYVYPVAKTTASYTVPEGTESIAGYSVRIAKYLESVTIPVSVTQIGVHAFSGCSNLTVYYNGTEEQWNAVKLDSNVFLSSVTMHYLAKGLIIIGGTAGTDYTYENGVLDIIKAGTYEIKNAEPTTATTDAIRVSAASGEVNITLNGVNIKPNDKSAFEITGDCETTVILKDGTENTLDNTTASFFAGLQNGEKVLTITCESSGNTAHECTTDCGKLTAMSFWGAGIGGGYEGSGSNITISGGTITAISTKWGAGIGGGYNGSGSNITISGGTVTATSAQWGAGIGGGDGGNGSNITISGGTVTATSAQWGAGIGGGDGGSAENIKTAPAANTEIIVNTGANVSEAAEVTYAFAKEMDITSLVSGNAYFYSEAIEHIHFGGTATCTEKAICTGCGTAYGDLVEHTYTASNNVITETCICGHSEAATVIVPTELAYDGNAKEATVAYSDNWLGGTLTIAYSEGGNVNAGNVTASIEKGGVAASVDYEIAKATPVADTESSTTASRIRKGNKLSASTITGGKYNGVDGAELAGTYAWREPDKEMTADGKEIVVFTPTDTNYAPVEIEVEVDVTSSSSSGGGVTRYTVKFDTDGGTEIANKSVTRNSKLAEPTAPEKEGYSFVGWFTDEELTEAYDFDKAVTKGFTLYVKWEKHDDDESVTSEWENPFTDVDEDDWFYNDVKFVHENELMNGTTDTSFASNTNITRVMLVTVLYRLEGEPATNRSIPFADIDMGAYYANAVIWAQQNGIVKGVSETEFAPDRNITREQIAAIMHRYAQYKEYDVTQGGMLVREFEDYEAISEYALTSMTWAVNSGLLNGKGDNTLAPQDNATRAECAAILHRFIEANK